MKKIVFVLLGMIISAPISAQGISAISASPRPMTVPVAIVPPPSFTEVLQTKSDNPSTDSSTVRESDRRTDEKITTAGPDSSTDHIEKHSNN